MELSESDFIIPEDQKKQLDRIPGTCNLFDTCHVQFFWHQMQAGLMKNCRRHHRAKQLL